MPQENIDRLRDGYEAFNRTGDMAEDLLAPNFELHQDASMIDSTGVFRGRDALRDSVHEVQVAFEELRFEPEKFIEAPNGEVVVLIHGSGRGRGGGVEIHNHIAHVWTFREQKAIRCVVYLAQAEALQALGLAE